MKLGCIITTYNKIEESYINQEIIRKLRTPLFDSIYIIHVYNGPDKIDKYLADELIYGGYGPTPHIGAANLYDVGFESMDKQDVDYICAMSSDTWRTDPQKVKEIVYGMKNTNRVYGGCTWGRPGMVNRRVAGLSTDTFFLEANFQKKNKVFPLKYEEYRERWMECLHYQGFNTIGVENLLAARYIQAWSREVYDGHIRIAANRGIYELKERLPAIISDSERHWNTPELGLYCDHNIDVKKKMLKDCGFVLGPYSEKRCMNQ